MNRRVVVGDVGGTHARWAVYNGTLGPVSVQQTQETRSLEESLARFLAPAFLKRLRKCQRKHFKRRFF